VRERQIIIIIIIIISWDTYDELCTYTTFTIYTGTLEYYIQGVAKTST